MSGNQEQLTLLRNIALGCFSLLAATSYAGPGLLDPTFAPTVNGAVYATAVQPDGRILLGGAFTAVNNSSSRYHLARLFADGSLDPTFFNTGSGVYSTVWCLAVQTDGRIVIGGDFTSVNGTARTRVARLNVNGTVDASFVPTNAISGSVLALAAQSDNKVIVGGAFYGTYFPSYNARLNADGTTDTAFSSYPNGAVNTIGIQSDGKIVIGGAFTQVNGAIRYHIARLDSDGSLDNAFQNGLSGASATVRCLQIQTDGKILIGGDFTGVNNTSRSFVARLNSNGTLDTGFISSPGASAPVYALAVQADSSVVIGGSFSSYASYNLSRVARLYADGTCDTSFTTSGINNLVQALAVQSDGGLLIGGTFTTINNSNAPYFGRLYGNLYPPEFIIQPVSRNTNVGASVIFSAMVSNPTPSYYQWRKEGNNILGATGMSYLLSNVQFADAGNYSVFVSNAAGGVTSSNAVLNVGIPPAITGQPAGQIVLVGSDFTLAVTATGSTPLAYQWRKDGGNLSGANGTSYTVTGAQTNDSGTYTVVVSNLAGRETSAAAVVNVGYAPVIVQQPQPFTNNIGTSNAFSVVVFGSEPFLYQWFQGGGGITDATNSVLTLSNLQVNDTGYYSVAVTNLYGWACSSNALASIPGEPPASLWQGLVAYYPFNGNANDASGNGNNGTVNGAVLTRDRLGAPNSAYGFNGSSSGITFDYPPLTQVDNWTLSAWMNPASLSQDGIAVSVGFDNASWGDGYGFGFGDSPALVGLFSGLTYMDTGYSVPDTNRWYHVVMLRQAGTARFFVDATQTPNTYTETPYTPSVFNIGSQSGAHFFNGQVDDVRIYNRALSSNEVAQLYAFEADIPVITAQPQGGIVAQGSTAALSVVATARSPLTYQWSRDGVPISTATNATLLIPDAQPSQVGLYRVAISNGLTGVVSAPAALAVRSSTGAGAPGFTSNLFGFGVSGPAASTFVVETSTNLQTWVPLSTNTFGAGLFQFVDPGSITNPIRFYRTRY